MNDNATIAAEKKLARAEAKKGRMAAHHDLRASAGALLVAHGLPFEDLPDGATFSGYYPYRSEIDVLGLMAFLAAKGFETCLPVVTGPGRRLQFRAWKPGDATVPGKWDIPTPPDSARVVEPDFMLVPLLAFDRAGYRLGYGGGFYDRTIADMKATRPLVTAGVAYSAQEMPQVPRGKFDQPLDWVLTEQGAIRCG